MDHRQKISFAIFLVLYFMSWIPKSYNLPNDMAALKANKTEEVKKMNDKYLTTVSNRLGLADKLGFGLKSECRKNFISAMNVTIDPRLAQITACYEDNIKNSKYAAAVSCYNKHIGELQKEETALHTAINGCIMLSCTTMYKVVECNIWFPAEKF